MHSRISAIKSYVFISDFVYSHHITWKRVFAIKIKFDFLLEASSLKINSLIEV